MSSGSQYVGDPVIPKFDMHIYSFVPTVDEVNRDKMGIYEQYLELSGVRAPFSTLLLIMIKHFRIHISQLVLLGLNRLTMFEIYYHSLNINPNINLLYAFYKLNKQGHWFSFECRTRKGGHDKIFNEFYTRLKHWKDHFFLINRRSILDAIPWRHKNSSVADPSPTGVRAGDIHRLCENIIDLRSVYPAMLYEIGLTTIWKHVGYHPVLKDVEGNVATSMSQFLKFSMSEGSALARGSPRVEHEDERVLEAKRMAQSAKDKVAGKRSHSAHSDEYTHAHSGEDGLYHDERDEHVHRHASGHVLSSLFGGSGRQVFSQRNPGGDALNDDYGELYQSHRSCQDVFDRLADTQNQLVDAIRSRNTLFDDHKILQQEHLGCVEEQIKRLEEALASKTSSLSKAESVASVLKGDLERLTMDLHHSEIIRHNYARQLLHTVI
uniref:Transposase (Putative), gypsy type n=1 Tax=Tanacetum cinerariifolium TaxID=118510 RepID=A0A6L2KH53_TANCI|nr:transposase (putative), gypsy type [Tanacetum cinerariifolium]